MTARDPLFEPEELTSPADEERDREDGEVEILGFEGASDGDDESAPRARPARDETAARELADLQERHLRLRADFDNFRKRMEREREETRRYALGEPLRELLPVLDNLDRAATAQGRLEDLQRGVEMVARQLAETLKRFGLSEVAALGEPFDPQVHEAVLSEESADVEVPTVVAEMQRGYRLHERLLRPALVRVAVPVASEAAGDTAAESSRDAGDSSESSGSSGGAGEAS